MSDKVLSSPASWCFGQQRQSRAQFLASTHIFCSSVILMGLELLVSSFLDTLGSLSLFKDLSLNGSIYLIHSAEARTEEMLNVYP